MAMIKHDKEVLEGKIKEGEKKIQEKVEEVEKQQEQIKIRDLEEQEMRFTNRGIAKFSEILATEGENLNNMSQTLFTFNWRLS